MSPLDKTTDKQLTVIHISDLLRRNKFQKLCASYCIFKKQRMDGFNHMQKTYLVTMKCDVCHTLIVMILLSTQQTANISIDSLLIKLVVQICRYVIYYNTRFHLFLFIFFLWICCTWSLFWTHWRFYFCDNLFDCTISCRLSYTVWFVIEQDHGKWRVKLFHFICS